MPLCPAVPCNIRPGGPPSVCASPVACRFRGLDWSSLLKDLHGEYNARPSHDAMPRHRTAGPRLGAVAIAPRWSTGPAWAACSNRWPCLKSRPRRGAVLAPGSTHAAHSGLWVRSAVALPFRPSPAHLSSARAHAPPTPLATPNPCSLAQLPVSVFPPPPPAPHHKLPRPIPASGSVVL